MYKFITTSFLLVFTALLSAQTKPVAKPKFQITTDQILGSWQLINYQFGPQAKNRKPLTLCDTLLRWNFVLDSATKKTLVKVVKTEECADYGFESDWQISGNSLLIKRTKILGFGGVSASGSFLIKQISKDQMILEFQKNKYFFRKM